MLLNSLEVKDRAGRTGCGGSVIGRFLHGPCLDHVFYMLPPNSFFPMLPCFKIHCIIFVNDDTMNDIYVFSFFNIFLHNFLWYLEI